MKRFVDEEEHTTVVVALVDNESGQGGRAVYTTSRNLTTASEFELVPAGAPSLSRDSKDPDIWYYNGTPAACTFVALDYILPKYSPGLRSSQILQQHDNRLCLLPVPTSEATLDRSCTLFQESWVLLTPRSAVSFPVLLSVAQIANSVHTPGSIRPPSPVCPIQRPYKANVQPLLSVS
jgi:Survival protein SurE